MKSEIKTNCCNVGQHFKHVTCAIWLPVTLLRGGGVRGPEAGLLVAGVSEVVELVVELRHVGQDGQPVRGRAWRHAA